MDVGKTRVAELSHNLMVKMQELEETTEPERMPLISASKLPEEENWFSLLFNMVVGVQVLLTLKDTEDTEKQAIAKTAKVVPGQMMYTVSQTLSDKRNQNLKVCHERLYVVTFIMQNKYVILQHSIKYM